MAAALFMHLAGSAHLHPDAAATVGALAVFGAVSLWMWSRGRR